MPFFWALRLFGPWALVMVTVLVLFRVRMPSFFGYMGWSVGILVPLFLIVTLVFFR